MTQHPQPRSTPRFTQIIHDALAHWQSRTAALDDDLIQALDADRENLFRLVEFGLGLAETQRETAVVIRQSFHFIERRGYWREWTPFLEKAIAGCTDEHAPLKLRLLNQLGQFHRFMRQLAPALAAHKEAETLARRLENKQMLAESHCYLSGLYLRQREYDKAETYGVSALDKFTEAGASEWWLAVTLSTLGELARSRGNLSLAEERLSQAVSYWRSLDDPVRIARALNDLAIVFLKAEQLGQAQRCYGEAAALLEPTNNELDKVMVQINLGVLYFKQERWTKAETAFRQADSTYLRWSPHIFYKALVANNLGNVLLKQERLGEAVSYLKNAITLWQQAEDDLERANTIGTLAEALVAQKKQSDALPLYEEAIDLLAKHPDDAWAKELREKFVAQRKGIQVTAKD